MRTTQQIADALFAKCLQAGHKPGKVQFTKYLYLLDYCHYRFTGQQATNIAWQFYHYGPWSPDAEACMSHLAATYGFSWREDEFTLTRVFEDLQVPKLGLTLDSVITKILGFFKNRDVDDLLEFAYNQTEPMLSAKRGEPLNFTIIPVDKTMPIFTPHSIVDKNFMIHPNIQARMEKMREKSVKWHDRITAIEAFRQTEPYQTALRYIANDIAGEFNLPDHLKARLSPESAQSFAED